MIIKDAESIDLDTPAGPMRTYVLRPAAAGRYPGVLLFSEIFQVTGPIRRTAALLAGHGFIVAVPEIFHELELPGTVLAYDQAGATIPRAVGGQSSTRLSNATKPAATPGKTRFPRGARTNRGTMRRYCFAASMVLR